jgi:hypothetical protein
MDLEHGPFHFSGKYSWPQKAAGVHSWPQKAAGIL